MSVRDLAAALTELGLLSAVEDGSPHRKRAYDEAAQVVLEVGDGVLKMTELELLALPWIGGAIAKKIIEWRETGSIGALERWRSQYGEDVLSLLHIPGLGPKTLTRLVREFGVRDRAGLGAFLRTSRAGEVMGRVRTQNLKEALERPPIPTGMSWPEAALLFQEAKEHLEGSGVRRALPAGAFARREDLLETVDILVFGELPDMNLGPQVRFVRADPQGNAALTLLRATADSDHWASLVSLAREKGLTLAEDRLVASDGRAVELREVGDIYRSLDLPEYPPETRWGKDSLAFCDRIKDLVKPGDLLGDLHTHTDASDGTAPLETMAEAARAKGYAYMAVTDHSPSLKIAGGLSPEEFRRQGEEIRGLNARLSPFRIFRGAEVDILKDGRLDLPDDLLQELDWVVISVHSHFALTEAENTQRFLSALAYPAVKVIGHPTARRLGKRHPISCHWETVFSEAIHRGVALEVNSSLGRMDLPAPLAKMALSMGAKLVVSTDAHDPLELDRASFGVYQARRAFARKADIVNCGSLSG